MPASAASRVLAMLSLLSAFGCASTESPERDIQTSWSAVEHSRTGLWAARSSESGKPAGSIRLEHSKGEGLVAEVLIAQVVGKTPVRLQLRSDTENRYTGSLVSPKAVRLTLYFSGRRTAAAKVTRGGTALFKLSQVAGACPVCGADTAFKEAFCSRCGRDLLKTALQDVRLGWAEGSDELFAAKELEQLLSGLVGRPHKIAISNCRLAVVDKLHGLRGIASWLLLGVFAGLQDWTYELSGEVAIDRGPAEPFQARFGMDFFDRNEGGRELFLAIFSFLYPAPLMSADRDVVARAAAQELARACAARLKALPQ
jgi:hypothetical protein